MLVLIRNLASRSFHALDQLGHFGKTTLIHGSELIESQGLVDERAGLMDQQFCQMRRRTEALYRKLKCPHLLSVGLAGAQRVGTQIGQRVLGRVIAPPSRSIQCGATNQTRQTVAALFDAAALNAEVPSIRGVSAR